MQFYKTSDKNANHPPLWSGSMADAGKDRVKMRDALKVAEKPHRDVDTVAVDVPTHKSGLLDYLNQPL